MTLSEYEGSFLLFVTAVMDHGFLEVCRLFGPQLTVKGVSAVVSWVGFQALLYRVLPGDTKFGQYTPAGHLLSYKLNGLSAWILTHALYGVLCWAGALDPGFIPRNWSSLIAAMNIAGFTISAFAFIKAHTMPSYPEDRKFSGVLCLFSQSPYTANQRTSGSSFYDFYMGIELNPRIDDNFDLKLFSNGRPGIIAWTLM